MFYNYNGTKIYYKLIGADLKRTVLLLHGWGRSHEDFDGLAELFSGRSFLAIDFPPFGKSAKDIEGWGIFTYAQMVMSLCEHLNIKSVDIVAHSFGGRVATILSAVECSFVHSCVLVGSAGMKPKRGIKYHCKVFKYKFCKKMGKNLQNQGSPDYQALSPEMKKTFVNVVETHLEEYAKQIKTKTLIVWGMEDKETPLYMAKRLNKLIKNSHLELLNGGHFAFKENKYRFFNLVKKFWEED